MAHKVAIEGLIRAKLARTVLACCDLPTAATRMHLGHCLPPALADASGNRRAPDCFIEHRFLRN